MVYLDVLLAVNLVMDYLILWVTARLGQLPSSGWRLLAAAAIGSVYSLVILFPDMTRERLLPVKVLFSVIMVLVAFYPLNGKRFVQALFYFYLAAFTMGGAMLGTLYLTGSGEAVPALGGVPVPGGNIRSAWLLVAITAAGLLALLGVGWIRKNFWQQVMRLPVVITFGERRRALSALVDTGNNLRDPLSQRPVIIVEYGAIKDILPPEIAACFSSQDAGDLERLVASCSSSPWATRVRLLPYQSLGQSHGLLVGLRPDEVIVVTNERIIKIKDVIVGLCRERLSPEGKYRALLPPDLLQISMGL